MSSSSPGLSLAQYPFGQAVESSDRRVKSDCAAAPFAATAVVDCLRPCGPSRLTRTLTPHHGDTPPITQFGGLFHLLFLIIVESLPRR